MSTLPPLLTINPTSLSDMPSIGQTHSIVVSASSSETTRPTRASTSTSDSTTPSKRRRQDTASDVDQSPSTGAGPIRNVRKDKDGPRKKKAARACIHCQKAHLTCDDSRPCQRCTRRGMAGSCVEGHRKRAKYLLGEAELELLKRNKTGAASSTVNTTTPPVQPQAPTPKPPSVMDTFPMDPLFNSAFETPSFLFGSEVANLEYSILSAILGTSSEGNPPTDSNSTTPPPSAHPFSTRPSSEYAHTWPGRPNPSTLSPSEPAGFLIPPFVPTGSRSSSTDFLDQSFSSLGPVSTAPTSSAQTPSDPFASTASQAISATSPSQSALHPLAPRWPLSSSDSAELELSGPKTAEEVYGSITKPYDYTEGYHFLMKVLPFRFEKNDILRIVRALAIFRPSLIALQMPLSEEDEIFVEKCVQRSVIELNKLIAYSGTPTVVWRRTGEICLVGPEFCMLTEWSKEELLGTKKYIWELFENQSAVEYWENFATHAFENTAQSVYSHCVLLKPDGTPVPATFCFHIRRDLFDLPSLVIGQWLPLL
ncbi:hypothetical protein F5148DRAFT_1173060 [Russula earlei]|uniref:Uncharacterized protein n=1 Tax=Russula earlei TaxID=71964 RepID=A0ACC0UHG3_9AGAM|nr:hypothetical protein F5148DRAFT_1173060 [Russula earlei]